MAELPDALRNDPQAAVAILTTEHFNLQTARGATISETNGREACSSARCRRAWWPSYLARPASRDNVADVLRTEGFASRWQLILTIVGAIGVINSVLLGVTAGLPSRRRGR